MAVLPKQKVSERRHAACFAAAIAVLNVSALLPAKGETIATFTRNPSNPILRGVRIGGETAARSLDAQIIHFIPRNETPAEQLGLVDELVRAKPDESCSPRSIPGSWCRRSTSSMRQGFR
jgi:ABC-type sugar transport system substrate-binding protein